MKSLTFCLLWITCALLPAPLVRGAYYYAAASAGGGATYLVQQGFEGTGYDNGETWTESGTGTIDEDYTTSPIVGSQSLKLSLSSNTGHTYVSHTAQDEVFYFFRCRIDSIDNAAARTVATILDSSGNLLATLSISTGNLLRVSANGGTNNSATDALSTATNYYIWFEYLKGTGSNAVARAGWSTDGTKPTLAASAARACVCTNGTVTAQAGRLRFALTASQVIDFVYDNVLADDVTIGSNP